MDLGQLQIVVDVVRRGSFAEVARERDLNPSSISRVIAGLEAELGFRIFQRSTRKMALTEAGEVYLQRIEAIAAELTQAQDDALSISSGPSGMLRLTASVAFGQQVIVPLIPRFKRAFPKIDLDLVLTDANVDLVAERIDLAIRLGAAIAGNLVVSKLFDTEYRVCASPAYAAREKAQLVPEDLSNRASLLFALPGFRSRWLFRHRAGGPVREVPVKGDVMVSGAMALRELALAGMGPALLGNWLVDADIASGRLVDLFPDFQVTATSFDTAVWLLYPSRSFLPQKVRVMIDFLRRELAAKDRAGVLQPDTA